MLTIITATIARPNLENILAQKWPDDVEHLVVIDGPEYLELVAPMVARAEHNVSTLTLPKNTGKWGNYARGIGTATVAATMDDDDFVAYLDDDNSICQGYFEEFIKQFTWEPALLWARCLRNFTQNGKTVFIESKHSWHIDTNCLLIRKPLCFAAANLWLSPNYQADRELGKLLRFNGFYHKEFDGRYVNYEIKDNQINLAGYHVIDCADNRMRGYANE